MQQQQQPQQQKQQLLTDLVAGMVTSGVYTSLTYPVHRVKILLQTQDANPRILSGVHCAGAEALQQKHGSSSGSSSGGYQKYKLPAIWFCTNNLILTKLAALSY
jgi:hypothetical protein